MPPNLFSPFIVILKATSKHNISIMELGTQVYHNGYKHKIEAVSLLALVDSHDSQMSRPVQQLDRVALATGMKALLTTWHLLSSSVSSVLKCLPTVVLLSIS